MRIKNLEIQNIRSYEKQFFEFEKGSTLLSGDIGTGKTSLLMAIEFALFGLQPGQKASSILRNGENSAKVRIKIEVENQEIIIERSLLKKSKAINQDSCFITINGETKELSVTELKSKVLEILNYPTEFSKKQNILYKFTVYTPQEGMKQIILEDSQTRLNTLRHVFGIDKYKNILENSGVVLTKIREEKRIKQAMTLNLDSDKNDLQEKNKIIKEKSKELDFLLDDLKKQKEFTKETQKQKQEIEEKILEKNKLSQESEKIQLMIATKENLKATELKKIVLIEKEIEELNKLNYDSNKILELEKEIKELKEKNKENSEKSIEIRTKIATLNIKNQENDSVIEKIKRIDICPTCLQDVSPVYKSNVSNKIESEVSKNISEIRELEIRNQELNRIISKIEYEQSIKERELDELKILKIKLEEIENKEIRKKDYLEHIEDLNKDILLLKEQVFMLRKNSLELQKYENYNFEKQKEIENQLKQERVLEIKVAEAKKTIELTQNSINELKEKINLIKEIQKEVLYLSKLEDWMTNKFTRIINNIEKNIMAKLKMEFTRLFSEWFLMLVSENFSIDLLDDFSPIIFQQDYEIDYSFLSGGEKTAIALAYRLALNQIINSMISKIKTKDLIILDEPTDGFSSQQLDKMRDVFQELNVEQLIIVSHEQKIESFVENVIKLKKEMNKTKIIKEDFDQTKLI